MPTKLNGSCLCGAVKYEIDNDFSQLYLCYCTQCRKISGSNHASNLFAKPDSFRWIQGEEKVKRFDFAGREFTNAFCIECGSGVPYLNQSRNAVIVRAGALESEPCFTTISKIFHNEAPKWNSQAVGAKIFGSFPIK